MLYEEDDINSVLNCPRCKKRYTKPKVIIPCLNTLCGSCVTNLCDGTYFKCYFCSEKHAIPQDGFRPDKSIERLLNIKPKQICLSNKYTRELNNKLNIISPLCESYSQRLRKIESELHEYCDSLRSQIHLVTARKINSIFEIRDKHLKYVQDYRHACMKNFESNQEQMNKNLKETREFFDSCTKYLKGFEIDDEVLKEKTKEAQWELERLQLAEKNLKFLTFNGSKIEFQSNNNLITDEFIGKFTKTQIQKLEYINGFKYTVISASEDKTLKIWDLKKGECLKTLSGHNDRILCLAVLDSNTIISGSSDNTLKIWKLNSGICVDTLKGHTDKVYCLSIVDLYVISGSFDKTIKFWNLENMQCESTLKASNEVWCLCLINPKRLVSGGKDNNLVVWNLDEQKPIRLLIGHSRGVECVCKIDNTRIVSGSSDDTLKVWNFETGLCLETLVGHTDVLLCVIKFDNNTIISGSRDKTIKIWKLDGNSKAKCVSTLQEHNSAVSSVCAIGKHKILSGSWDNTIKVWNVDKTTSIKTINAHYTHVVCISALY